MRVEQEKRVKLVEYFNQILLPWPFLYRVHHFRPTSLQHIGVNDDGPRACVARDWRDSGRLGSALRAIAKCAHGF